MQFEGELDRGRGGAGELVSSRSSRNLGKEDFPEEMGLREIEEMKEAKPASNLSAGSGQEEQKVVSMQREDQNIEDIYGFQENDHEADPDISSFLRGASVGSELLIAELQDASDSLEDMENTVQIKIMVNEAILRGIVSAMEADANDAVDAKKAELQRVKEQLHERDSIVGRLIEALQSKEDELSKVIQESNCKEHKLVMDMLTERERALAKVKECEKFFSSKEKEILTMAETMVKLARNLDDGSKRVLDLERQLKESKEAESLKAKEMMTLMDQNEKLKAEKDSVVEMVRREARLRELRWTESLEEKDKLLKDQLHRIENLECAQQDSWQDLQLQIKEVARLEQACEDSSNLIAKLTTENQVAADRLDARERRLKSLDEDIQQLNKSIQELRRDNLKLVEELDSQRTELEAKENELVKQRKALRDAEVLSQTFSRSEEDLQRQISEMNISLQQYMWGTQSLKAEMEEQSWMHKIQTGMIMETFKGKVGDLARHISLLDADSKPEQTETLTAQSAVLEKTQAELMALTSSKQALEGTINELHAVIKNFEQSMEEKDKLFEDKVRILQQAEDGISGLEEKLSQKRELFCRHENEIKHVQSHQKMLDENAQMLREAEGKILNLEQELGAKQVLVQKFKSGLDERSWRVGFEEKFLSTYVESSFKEFLKQIGEIQSNLVKVGEKLVAGQDDLEAARVELAQSKAEVERLKSDVFASSKFVDQLQTEVRSDFTELSQARVEVEEALSQSQKEKVELNEGCKQRDSQMKEMEEKLSKNRDDALKMLEKLVESEWKSQVQTSILLGLVEGWTQERRHKFSQLEEEIKQKHQEILSLRSEVEEQNKRLNAHVSDISDLRIALVNKDQELRAFIHETELTTARQRDAHVHELSIVREAFKEIEDLRQLKVTLFERIEEEKQRVRQLEEALVEQKFKHQVEVDLVSTLLWQGGAGRAATWDKEKSVLENEVTHLREELAGKKHDDNVEPPEQFSHDRPAMVAVEPHLVGSQGKTEEGKKETQDRKEMSSLAPDPIIKLERENSELRREKEQILEQKTDEIYKLKREFYKQLEKYKGETKYDSEISCLKYGLSAGDKAWEVKESKSAASANVAHEEGRDSDSRVGWDSEKSTLLESISQRDEHIKERDERIKDVSNRLSHALEKEKTHVSTRLSLVENLAALEKERNRLNSVHEREKEKLTLYYKKLLAEKETGLSRAIKNMEEKSLRISELERDCLHSRDENAALKSEMATIRKALEIDLAGQIQAFVGSSEQLERNVYQRMKQYNLRLEAARSLVKCLSRQLSMLSLNETDNLQHVHNLQKAEAEVDLLGDEVDALLDILEKVHAVLNHYAPVIQHYPGLAELLKVVRKEIVERVYESKDV